MKKEIKVQDEKLGVVRITTADERWYAKATQDDKTGLPVFKALPSVTWILSVYPKLGLMRLRDELGADETDQLKKLGGERGSRVHNAISAILAGDEVRVDSKFDNGNGIEEELTADDIRCIVAFKDWEEKVKPKWLAWDVTLYSEKHGFAGTLDAIAEIDNADGVPELWLIDFKTSKVLGTDYSMQVSAYREAIVNLENSVLGERYVGDMKCALLQLGTKPLKTNPAEYRWKEVEPCFDLFLATRKIWADVYATQIADERGFSQKDYPIVLSAGATAADVSFEEPVVEVPADEPAPAPAAEAPTTSRSPKKTK